jgi:trans-aconitate methyltransferase
MDSSYYDKVFSRPKYLQRKRFLYPLVAKYIFERLSACTRVLDVGCGPGVLISILSQKFPTDGIDSSAVAIQQARERNPFARIHHMDLYKFRHWKEYDVFVMVEVLEHVQDDLALLHFFPPGGLVFATVPLKSDHTIEPSHIRSYQDPDNVRERYAGVLQDFDSSLLREQLVIFNGRIA